MDAFQQCYVLDDKINGIKVGFRCEGMKGVPLMIADKVLKKIRLAFNVQ